MVKRLHGVTLLPNGKLEPQLYDLKLVFRLLLISTLDSSNQEYVQLTEPNGNVHRIYGYIELDD